MFSAGYTPAWEAHVLAHVPLYTSLLPLFLRQTAARASQYGNPVLEDLKHVRVGLCLQHTAHVPVYTGLFMQLLQLARVATLCSRTLGMRALYVKYVLGHVRLYASLLPYS